MSRYNLRPNLLEDTLQEFELVRLQGVEWRGLEKRHRHLSKILGSAFPSMTSNTRGDLAFRVLLLSLMRIKPKPRCRVRGFAGGVWASPRWAGEGVGERSGPDPITLSDQTVPMASRETRPPLVGLGPGFRQRDEPLLAAAIEVTLEDFEESRQPRLPSRIEPTTELVWAS
jgi:hypothetical protein